MKTNVFARNIELTLILMMREIKGRYKGSLLGPAWVVVYPLLLTSITTLVFSYFVKIQTDPIPYSLFAFSGILIWSFFTKAVGLGTRSLVMNRELIVETPVTPEILPISYILGSLPDLFINLVILFFFLLAASLPVSLSILIVPALIFLLCVFIFGLTLFLATANVLYKDTQNLLEPVLLIWFYITPILYPPSVVPNGFQWILWINPMSFFLTMIREVVFFNKFPSLSHLSVVMCFTAVTYLAGYAFFRKFRPIFADII